MKRRDVKQRPGERSGGTQGLQSFTLNTQKAAKALSRKRSKLCRNGKPRDLSPRCSSIFVNVSHRTCICGGSVSSVSDIPVESRSSGSSNREGCARSLPASSGRFPLHLRHSKKVMPHPLDPTLQKPKSPDTIGLQEYSKWPRVSQVSCILVGEVLYGGVMPSSRRETIVAPGYKLWPPESRLKCLSSHVDQLS